MIKAANFEKVEVTSAADLCTWLEENHGQDASIRQGERKTLTIEPTVRN